MPNRQTPNHPPLHRRGPRRVWLASAGLVLLAVIRLHGGGPTGAMPAEARQETATFGVKTALAVLHVTVKDRHGAYVTGLDRDAFTVFEDGRPRVVDAFTAHDSPATVGLLVDGSGSMRERRSQVVTAAQAFAASGHADDDRFALVFNERVRAALPAAAPFTSDPETLVRALAGTIRAAGRTALYDAIAHGLDYVERGRHPRHVLVVVADGGDNASAATFDSVLRRAQTSNAAVYTVGVIDPLERDTSRKRLRALARATGGESFFPEDAGAIGETLRRVAEALHHTYTIGYVPAVASNDDHLRSLRVHVRVPDGRRVTVRTREGYRPPGDR